MLKGANKLVLTHETVREAIEQYLRSGLVEGDKLTVQTVSESSERGGYTTQKSFDVQVVETTTLPIIGS